eukprot:gene15860-18846_t
MGFGKVQDPDMSKLLDRKMNNRFYVSDDGSIIECSWSWGLILASFLVSFLGSYTSLQILQQLSVTSGRWMRQMYFTIGSISLGGCAIWSMHFIGMLALTMKNISIMYDVKITIVSGVVAMIACRIGLLLLTVKFPRSIMLRIGDDQPLLINQSAEVDGKKVETHHKSSSSSISPICINRKSLVKSYFKSSRLQGDHQHTDGSSSPLSHSSFCETPSELTPPDSPGINMGLLSTEGLPNLSDIPQRAREHPNDICLFVDDCVSPQIDFQGFSISAPREPAAPKKRKPLYRQFSKLLRAAKGYNSNTMFRLTLGSLFLSFGIIVFLSFMIAWIASFAALNISAFTYTQLQHLASALVMGLDDSSMSPDIFDGDQKKRAAMFNANKAIQFASKMLEIVEYVNLKYNYEIHLRIGINTGEAVAGVIGKKKFSFDVWGDAVNVSARMESNEKIISIFHVL